MQRSIDDLIAEWDQIKDCKILTPATLEEAVKFSNTKDSIGSTVHALQISRLQNDLTAEALWSDIFSNMYNQFTKEYTFRILKGDRKT